MKRRIGCWIIAAALCLGCGCAFGRENGSFGTEQRASIDWTDYEILTQRLVNPLVSAGMVEFSWESPRQLTPDAFLFFFIDHCMKNQTLPDNGERDEEWKTLLLPAEFVEQNIQKYFAVDSERLRQSKYYDIGRNKYRIDGETGVTVIGKIVNVAKTETAAVITLECYRELERVGAGEVTVALGSDGGYVYQKMEYHAAAADESGTAGQPWSISDYDSLAARFINPLLPSSLLNNSWEDPNQANPDAFPYFYLSTLSSGGDPDAVLPNVPEVSEKYHNVLIPARMLEPVVQKYFRVDTPTLRRSADYHADKNKYELWGLGSVMSADVTNAAIHEGILTLEFELRRDAEFYKNGSLSIKLFDDGNFQYLSYRAAS